VKRAFFLPFWFNSAIFLFNVGLNSARTAIVFFFKAAMDFLNSFHQLALLMPYAYNTSVCQQGYSTL
jgi:hypothetical protein